MGEDTDSDTAVDTLPLDTPDLATAVDTTEDSATEVTDTPVLEATTASVRLRPSPRLMPMLRLIPTTDTVTPDLATLALGATEDMDTPVVTAASVRPRPSPRLMLM